ncbi:MAG: GDP-mannose 4,6-dehydratase [Nanoarchaeota archaeon]|nr:GDP-mannose 4,6-dehydratase [Nanoarchaeota archaeon]
MKKALITGITGQDGSYLAEFLLEKGYEVYGMYRRSSEDISERLFAGIIGKIHLVEADLTDSCSLFNIIKEINPDEIYNLGAQSFVWTSFDQPEVTTDVNALGPLRILWAIKQINPKIKFYQASSSEQFGNSRESSQKETTRFSPRSPYGISKLYAFEITKNYRESYGIFACNGILFNHESPRRGKQFVTRKVTEAVARIHLGLSDKLELGNWYAKRDWGHARDYVEAMWLMLQQDKPDDYVIATGINYSVKELIEEAFRGVGREVEWEGEGLNEVGKIDGKVVVKVNPEFYRPAELDELLGDSSKARKELGWSPKISFKGLIKEMVESDLKILKKEYNL